MIPTRNQLQWGILKVTLRRAPVAVVLPGYWFTQVLTTLQKEHIEVKKSSLTLRQAQKAFNSYGKLLAPLLEGERLVAITSRNHAIGGIVSWKLWSAYLAKGETSWIPGEGESRGERVLTLVAARNRLADLPESFAREQLERGSSEPIHVTKNGRHVFTIVPFPMDDSLLQFLLKGRRVQATTKEGMQESLHVPSDLNE